MKILLKVGIADNILRSNIIKEILNHQGILYEFCEDNFHNYTCIISTENKYARFENFILLDKEFLRKYLETLEGSSKFEEEEMMNASLMEYEIELTNKIKERFTKKHLPFVRKWFWPDFKKACYVITHDIDEIDRCPSKKRSLVECMKYVISHIMFKSYGDNINTILKLEGEKSIKSTFYFFPEYKQKQHFIDLVNKIKTNEHEIGLHGSPEAAIDKEKFAIEKQKLYEICTNVLGYRQHTLTLAFHNPITLQILNDCNIIYDVSIACNKKFGFKADICYPYHPFDIENDIKFNILELPSPYMDWTGLFRNFDKKRHLEIIKKLKNTVEKYNGSMVFSFHNSYINRRLYPEIYETFIKTLSYISGEDYWVTTSNGCTDWWLKRENAKLDMYFEDGKINGRSDVELPIQIDYRNKIKNIYVNKEFELRI